MVESQRTVGGETTKEIRYYLNSFPSNGEVFAHAVRSHWGIENSLHWVLDISFREDDCRIRKDNSPENFALLRHIALNLLSQEKTAAMGIQNKRLQAAWDNNYLVRVLGI
jgi:predicted transposase YbfD/YdcC